MILVTGAAGLSGSIIVRNFAERQTKARALARNRLRAPWLGAFPTIEVVEGYMRRPETLDSALQGIDRVLMISSSDPQMVETQCAFIDVCKRAGVEYVVKLSGKESSIGFDPQRFRFTRMHEEIERYLEYSGLGWTHLRPSQFMQVYFRELPTIVAQGAFFLPMENAQLAPVDIEDIAEVAFALLHDGGHMGKSYDMTGPEALTMTQVAERISRAIGKTVRYVDVAPEKKRQILLAAGVPPERADALDELFAERRKRPESMVYLDTHEAFGVRPTTFEEFARRNAAVFRGEVPA